MSGYVYIQLIHTIAQQILTKHCKAIIYLLKNNLKQHKIKNYIRYHQKKSVSGRGAFQTKFYFKYKSFGISRLSAN